ncbi:MAG: hypothetical protein Q7T21_12655 [Gallionella sp.]|nr:hypothetical protein [Gallionella sp.]
MTEYRRAHVPGASWFFTVNLAQRKGNSLLVERIDVLRAALKSANDAVCTSPHPTALNKRSDLPACPTCV